MSLSPDDIIYWQAGFFKLNATILWTWVIMLFLVIGARLITRRLSTDIHISRWQNMLEIIVLGILQQMKEVGLKQPQRYIGYLGTLFIFIVTANLCTIFPVYEPPTGSLSTTAGLAISVFIAVPLFGIEKRGLMGYIKTYLEPTPIMLPFNIVSEFSRTLALSVRLFGNIMSGSMILAILLTITPFIFPIIMTLLGLLTGVIQAYIFSILATVFVASAMQSSED
ncbi:MAG: F0F1 ATP synthase subunit A [Saprospiraceae bacterium]